MTTVRLLVVNAMSVSTGSRHAADIFRAGLDLNPDVVLATECSDFTAADVDKDGLYAWHQLGRGPGDTAGGCAIGVRKAFGALLEADAKLGSFATSEGRAMTGHGIGDRLILRARVRTAPNAGGLSFRVAVGHAPPSRAPKARAEFMRAFARTTARFKGGDLNLSQRLASRALGRRVTGQGVLWLAMPRQGWRLVETRAVNVGGDHRAVLSTVRRK